MKKSILILLVLIMATLLASCSPQEVLPFCKEAYEDITIEYPGFPHAFIGACVASLNGETAAPMTGLCRNEVFREYMADELEVDPLTQEECIQIVLEE